MSFIELTKETRLQNMLVVHKAISRLPFYAVGPLIVVRMRGKLMQTCGVYPCRSATSSIPAFRARFLGRLRRPAPRRVFPCS
jgi:hypothetical protein